MKTIKLTYNGVIYSKKNSKKIVTNQRTGKPQIISSQRARDMESNMVSQFMVQAYAKGWKSRISGETKATYNVYINVYEKDHTRRDLDNQATSVLDALVSAMILPDDSVKYVQGLYVYYAGVDKENPRAEITIEEF